MGEFVKTYFKNKELKKKKKKEEQGTQVHRKDLEANVMETQATKISWKMRIWIQIPKAFTFLQNFT